MTWCHCIYLYRPWHLGLTCQLVPEGVSGFPFEKPNSIPLVVLLVNPFVPFKTYSSPDLCTHLDQVGGISKVDGSVNKVSLSSSYTIKTPPSVF